MSVATFPPPSPQAQLEELRRELGMRNRVYPHLVSTGKLKSSDADYRNRGLVGAIATLEKIAAAQGRGEPGRKELIEALREALPFVKSPNTCAPSDALAGRIEAMLAKVPL